MPGCTNTRACNYKSLATVDDGGCQYPKPLHDCFDQCAVQVDCTGKCGGGARTDVCGVCGGDNSGCTGCMNRTACNYDPSARVHSKQCVFEAKVCGVCGGDGKACTGCKDSNACNYDVNASVAGPASSCRFPKSDKVDCDDNCLVGSDCKGTCGGPVKVDKCGVCGGDDSLCTGCMDEAACNHNSRATISDPLACVYPASQLVDCNLNCLVEVDCDGVCGGYAQEDSCGDCGGDGGRCETTTAPPTTSTAACRPPTITSARMVAAPIVFYGAPMTVTAVTDITRGCEGQDISIKYAWFTTTNPADKDRVPPPGSILHWRSMRAKDAGVDGHDHSEVEITPFFFTPMFETVKGPPKCAVHYLGVRVTVTYQGGDSDSGTVTAWSTQKLNFKRDAVHAVIANLDRTISASQPLFLNGENSFDADVKGSDWLQYRWVCDSTPTGGCDGLDADWSSALLSLAPNTLRADTTYKFTLNVSSTFECGQSDDEDGKREGGTFVMVKVLPSSETPPPQLGVVLCTRLVDCVGSAVPFINGKATVHAGLHGGYYLQLEQPQNALGTVNDVFVEWSTEMEKNNIHPVSTLQRHLLSRNKIDIFKISVPTHAKGSYAFTLFTDTGLPASRHATVQFALSVNTGPSGGVVDVTPKTGQTMSTLFQIRHTRAWTDADLPIRYRFSLSVRSLSGETNTVYLHQAFAFNSYINNARFPVPGP